MGVPAAAAAFVTLFAAALICQSSASKKVTFSARKGDIQYIKCDTCDLIVKQLLKQYKNKTENTKPPKKVSEFQIIEMVEKVCDEKRDEGEWISRLDIVESEDKLKLEEQEHVGECRNECKTIQRTCQDIIGDHDTDVAEFIFSGKANRASLTKLLCYDLSKACSKKPPPVPKDRSPGEDFVKADSEKVKMDKMLRDMNVKPQVFHDVKDEDIPNAPKMKMYSRDELMKGNIPGYKSTRGPDDDEDDEDEL